MCGRMENDLIWLAWDESRILHGMREGMRLIVSGGLVEKCAPHSDLAMLFYPTLQNFPII